MRGLVNWIRIRCAEAVIWLQMEWADIKLEYCLHVGHILSPPFWITGGEGSMPKCRRCKTGNIPPEAWPRDIWSNPSHLIHPK